MLSLNTILISCLVFILTASNVRCKEEFIIAYAPKSVGFKTMQPISTSSVANLFSAILGYTTHEPVPNLIPVNPLNRPEAIVNFEFEGLSSYNILNTEGDHFALHNKFDLNDQYYIVEKRTQKRYASKWPTLLRLNAGDDLYNEKSSQAALLQNFNPDKNVRLEEALKDDTLSGLVKSKLFNQSLLADQQFLIEIETLNNLRDVISKAGASLVHNGAPEVFWFKLSSLQDLNEAYGSSSKQSKKALELFNKEIKQFVDAVRKVYNDQVLVTVITTTMESEPSKVKRAIENLVDRIDNVVGKTEPIFHDANLATEWTEDFHVAFMMILFVSILFILAVLGISIGMWNLDPGKDSLIYRMTGQRLKKD